MGKASKPSSIDKSFISKDFAEHQVWMLILHDHVISLLSPEYKITRSELISLGAVYAARRSAYKAEPSGRIKKFAPSICNTTIYYSLNRLVELGYIEVIGERIPTGRRKTYYSITGTGFFVMKEFDRVMKIEKDKIKKGKFLNQEE